MKFDENAHKKRPNEKVTAYGMFIYTARRTNRHFVFKNNGD